MTEICGRGRAGALGWLERRMSAVASTRQSGPREPREPISIPKTKRPTGSSALYRRSEELHSVRSVFSEPRLPCSKELRGDQQ